MFQSNNTLPKYAALALDWPHLSSHCAQDSYCTYQRAPISNENSCQNNQAHVLYEDNQVWY